MTRKNYTKIGVTKDGAVAYWGKKDSDDPESRDLTLWVDIRGEYFRVPANSEIAHSKGEFPGAKWDKHIASLLSNETLANMKKTWISF